MSELPAPGVSAMVSLGSALWSTTARAFKLSEPYGIPVCSVSDKIMSVDGLVEHLVQCAINRGAWSIEISLEGACASITDDAPARFDDFTGELVAGLADPMTVELHDESSCRSLDIARGQPTGAVREHGASEWSGCRVSFRADPAIYGDAVFDREHLNDVLKTLCALHPSLTVIVDGEDLSEPRGLAGEVARVVETPIHSTPLRFAGHRHDVQIDVALQWGRGGAPSVRCFDADHAPRTPRGFWLGLLDAARGCDINDRVVEELLRPGLVALVSAIPDTEGADVEEAIREVTREGLEAHKTVLDRVIALRSRSTL